MTKKDDNIVDAIGYSGGVILSLCLIPQIVTIIKTKQVNNISYLWQILYIIGIVFHLYYGIYYNLLPIFIPTIIELVLILLMCSLKIIFSNRVNRNIVNENV